jgi:hypothetical protein
LVADQAIDQLQKDYVTPNWSFAMVEALLGTKIRPLHITAFLMEDDHCDVLEANSSMSEAAGGEHTKKKAGGAKAAKAKAQQKLKSKKAKLDLDGEVVEKDTTEKFQVEHLDKYTQHSLPWPPVFDGPFLEKADFLTRRRQEILWLECALAGPAKEMTQWACRDLNMTMEWGQCRTHMLPCIVSSSLMWLRGPVNQPTQPVRVVDRLVAGSELLCMQGLGFFMQGSGQAVFNNKDKTDLAGNAFNGAVVGAMLTATMMQAPVGIARSFSMQAFVGSAVEAVADDSGADDSEGSVGEEDLESESLVAKSLDGDSVEALDDSDF